MRKPMPAGGRGAGRTKAGSQRWVCKVSLGRPSLLTTKPRVHTQCMPSALKTQKVHKHVCAQDTKTARVSTTQERSSPSFSVCCVTLGKLLNLSEFQFFHLSCGTDTTSAQNYIRLKEKMRLYSAWPTAGVPKAPSLLLLKSPM